MDSSSWRWLSSSSSGRGCPSLGWGGANEAQLIATRDVALDRLAQMQAQRAELDIAISELQTQIREAEATLAAFRRAAAE